MKWTWRTGVAAGGVLLAAGLAMAQLPGGLPAGAGAGAGAGAAAGVPGAAAPAAPQPGILGKMCANLDACRQKICGSPLGAMLNNATMPLGAMTGGIIPPFCPAMPSAADLLQPGVAGASDAIKKDALEAKMRRDKVRYLGTVDCRYYPDAIGALTAALRTDGSECVRYEAALALNRGCCCNQRTIDALTASVSGTDRDGNPAERSVRVRCVAATALDRCLSCYVPPPVEKDPIEGNKELKGGEIAPPPSDLGTGGKKSNDAPPLLKLPDETGSTTKGKTDANAANHAPSRESVALARRALNEFNALVAASRTLATAPPPGERYSVYQLIKNSASVPSPAATSAIISETPVAQTQPGPMPCRPTLGQPKAEPIAASPVGPVAGQPPRPLVPDAMPSIPMIPTAVPASPGVGSTRPDVKTSAPMVPTVPQVPVFTSAIAAQPASPSANPVTQVVAQVINGPTPLDRHTAIRQLVLFDWHKNPVVVSALVEGAKSDPTPAVRVDCLRHLAGYQMTHPQVLMELAGLVHDGDPWVREEAARALAQLKQNP